MYHRVSEADIASYEASYRGSKEEEADLAAFYSKNNVILYI